MLVEKRKFKRFDVPLDVKFRPTENSPEYFSATIRNFSREGFCLELQNFALELKDTIEFVITLPDKNTFVPVLGNIIWKEQINTKYLAGIKIKEIDKEAKSEILDYAYNIWVEKKRS